MAQTQQIGQRSERLGPFLAVDPVVDRMRSLRSAWHPADGVAVFNRVYLTVTEEIGHAIEAGTFADRRGG
ncbi:DUF5995 family protein, partial [Streptomyces sp. SS]|uniref:DUF5995 family protein n=1 Tax=Streptomyces sp. SS TaxID=260742 RepID=UPI001ED987C3